jgi:hypothetical protein
MTIEVNPWPAAHRRPNLPLILPPSKSMRTPDREANTLVRWLEQRLGVQIVSRDRASAYVQAAAVPGATQVADRFHLLVNLRESMEQAFQRNAGAVRAALDELKTPSTMNAPPPVLPFDPRRGASIVDRQSRFDCVRALH